MEAVLLCLLLNELLLFSLTQNRFILIQFVTFTCVLATCSGMYLSYPQTSQYKSLKFVMLYNVKT